MEAAQADGHGDDPGDDGHQQGARQQGQHAEEGVVGMERVPLIPGEEGVDAVLQEGYGVADEHPED